MMGSTTSEYLPRCGTFFGWSDRSKVKGDLNHQRKAGVTSLAT
jgi:hypothetical protein